MSEKFIDIHRGPFDKIDKDGMPADIALQNLVSPTQNVSSSFKRECVRAREIHYTIQRPGKTQLQIQANRMRRKPIKRVLRAFARAVRKLTWIEKHVKADNDRQKEIKNALMAPLIAVAVAARNETAARSRSIALYTAYKLLTGQYPPEEIAAARKFLLESLVPITPPSTNETLPQT